MPTLGRKYLLPRSQYLKELHEEAERSSEDGKVVVEGAVTVKAEGNYVNGEMGQIWKQGDVRSIPLALYKRLMADNPYNWTVVHG